MGTDNILKLSIELKCMSEAYLPDWSELKELPLDVSIDRTDFGCFISYKGLSGLYGKVLTEGDIEKIKDFLINETSLTEKEQEELETGREGEKGINFHVKEFKGDSTLSTKLFVKLPHLEKLKHMYAEVRTPLFGSKEEVDRYTEQIDSDSED